MAKETAVELFIGEDKEFRFPVLNEGETAAIDVAAWTFSWRLKRKPSQLDAESLLTKTSSSGIAVSGVYSATPSLSAQRVVVTIADTDTDALKPGGCVYELKRMDTGAEVVIAYGPLNLRRSVHHA